MKNNMNSIPIFCFIFLTLCSHQILANEPSKASTVSQDVQGPDLIGLAKFALTCASTQARQTTINIAALDKETAEEYTSARLSQCMGIYESAIMEIDGAMKALQDKGYDAVRTAVSTAMTNAETCQEGFQDEPGHVSPLTKQNDIFNQACSVVLAVVKMMSG